MRELSLVVCLLACLSWFQRSVAPCSSAIKWCAAERAKSLQARLFRLNRGDTRSKPSLPFSLTLTKDPHSSLALDLPALAVYDDFPFTVRDLRCLHRPGCFFPYQNRRNVKTDWAVYTALAALWSVSSGLKACWPVPTFFNHIIATCQIIDTCFFGTFCRSQNELGTADAALII